MQPSAKYIGGFYINIYTSLAVKDTDSGTYMMMMGGWIVEKKKLDEETFKNRRFVLFFLSFLFAFTALWKALYANAYKKYIFWANAQQSKIIKIKK